MTKTTSTKTSTASTTTATTATTATDKRRAVATTERAGLRLSVRRTEKLMRRTVPGTVRLSTMAVIGATAAVESVLKTLLERAAECSGRERKTHRINGGDIALAVHTTPALHALLGRIEMPRRMPIAKQSVAKTAAAQPKRRQTKRRALNAIVST